MANLTPFSMDALSSGFSFSKPSCSKSERGPKSRTSSTPFFPSLTCKQDRISYFNNMTSTDQNIIMIFPELTSHNIHNWKILLLSETSTMLLETNGYYHARCSTNCYFLKHCWNFHSFIIMFQVLHLFSMWLVTSTT